MSKMYAKKALHTQFDFMTNTELEIIGLYEKESFSVDDISVELDLDAVAVKMILGQYSKKYRDEGKMFGSKEVQSLEFANDDVSATQPTARHCNLLTDEEHNSIKQVLKDLAIGSDNDVVRARVSIYLHEEHIGRNEARIKNVNRVGNINVNVLTINEGMRKAREAIRVAKQQQQQLIDV